MDPWRFKDATTLLRVLLIHLVDGCSLRESVVRADAGGLIKVSDVAFMQGNRAMWGVDKRLIARVTGRD